VLVRADAHGLDNGAILTLAGLLLEKFVGDIEAGDAVLNLQTDAVAVGEIAFIADGVVAVGAGIVEVLLDYRVEEVLTPGAVSADGESVFAPLILAEEITVQGVVTAAVGHEFAVKPVASVTGGFDFDDSAKFAAELRGIASGEYGEGLHVVAVGFDAKAGRAIVRKRYAIETMLRPGSELSRSWMVSAPT
jgi:hypothetical protein